ncbi:transglutaminase family protein [Brenneria izbisi]|uniref:Transglutaminase family protein n=1 Tax=Brenneria izbisi TaxID=2939450 RepID=A0AA41XY82_9GAMM|nr:transglutaminase family protein [Brenneria izbisi]MCV9879658.1 transglutaminase family protein [Brenneria izbisi]MCV9883148.1 transglutaminase family protein [Brenneria izbisi]
MKLTINHLTHYHYDEEVKFSTQYLRLTPQDSAHQKIREWKLTLPATAVETTDAYGNVLHVLTLDHPHHDITIHAQGVVEIADNAITESTAESSPAPEDTLSPLVFLRITPLTEADADIREFAQRYYRPDAPEESLNTLMAELAVKMPYTPGATQVQDSAAVAFAMQKGVCQDHTHVFLACCRSLHIPARYVSGYVYSQDSQHVAMHAWAEVWLNGRWQGFDITNNTRLLHQHLWLAIGMDYLDACPVRGTRLGGGCEEMFSEAEVRLFERQQQVQQQQ